MADSEWNYMLQSSKIVVKELPSSAPFWAVPFSFFPDDNPYYRCEYYRFRSPMLFSAQTHQGESFTVSTARVEWSDAGDAIVYLDDVQILECNAKGYWSKAP